MSKVFVSKDLVLSIPEGYNRYLKVSDIPKNVPIDVLIYHTSNESTDDTIQAYLGIASNVQKLFYIANPDNINSGLELFFMGANGTIEKDEIFLSDSVLLSNLVSSSGSDKSDALAIPQGTLNILDDFYDKIGTDQDFSPGYLTVVGKAISDVVQRTNKADEVIQAYSETTMSTYKNMHSSLVEIQKNNKNLSESLTEIQSRLSKITTDNSGTRSNVIYYPQIPYNTNKPIIQIKEIGTTPYVTSFMIGLLAYSNSDLRKKTKLLIVVPPGTAYKTAYSNLPDSYFIDSTNIIQRKLLSSQILITNNPLNSILTKIANLDDELLLVLDKTKHSVQPIYKVENKYNSTSLVMYAVQSKRIKDLFIPNIPLLSCFSSINEIKGTKFNLVTLQNYSQATVTTRISYYKDLCKEVYNTLTKKVL